ncbi:MAG: hypothetical protein IPF55_19385 [Rhodoferax sp.]|nr:hypothetical protein [Rhodoferax sp.]
MTADPALLTLALVPGCVALQSPWPVVSILGAHRDGTPSLGEVGERLRAGVAESAVVWRDGLRACVRNARAGEAVFLAALRAGLFAGDRAGCGAHADFNTWLPMAVTTGLLLGAQPGGYQLTSRSGVAVILWIDRSAPSYSSSWLSRRPMVALSTA